MKVPLTYSSPMDTVRIGYARCSTDRQDLTAQRSALVGLVDVDADPCEVRWRNVGDGLELAREA